MTTVSYSTLLSNWFRVHIPLPKKSNTFVFHTGCTAAYPEIKRSHRRRSHLFSCIPFFYQSKNKTYDNGLKVNKKKSSIKGCASFARSGTYQEGDIDDDC